ncbi:methylated-DNA--[protein]-cysteine S-methyltransferase [Porticoccus sp.]|uniref:methylated-DNA--[protein]-cysteine S-methyltransferase n=1 Tax=Porticoccus sp. TaxID=2024853 RepID=UPI003F69DDC2
MKVRLVDYQGGADAFYGQASSPFGMTWLVWTVSGIEQLVFQDRGETDPFRVFPRLDRSRCFHRDDANAALVMQPLFKRPGQENSQQTTLMLSMQGTAFQRRVWQVLLSIPFATVSTYQQIASAIDQPKAVRAVASAIGANPVAWLVPCHRVIRSNGELGGYRWGFPRKQQMLDWERAVPA